RLHHVPDAVWRARRVRSRPAPAHSPGEQHPLPARRENGAIIMAALAAAPKTPRKKLVRRAAPDRSQALRHAIQAVFLAINVWIGVEFYLFVRFYESGGQSLRATRPPGLEGWLPIASLM